MPDADTDIVVESADKDDVPQMTPAKLEEEKLFKKKVRKAIDKRRAADAKKGKLEVCCGPCSDDPKNQEFIQRNCIHGPQNHPILS